MTTTPEEQADLEKLKADIQQEKLQTWTLMKEMLTMDIAQLAACGHRNGNAQAVFDTMKGSLHRVQQLEKAFLKKWPDK